MKSFKQYIRLHEKRFKDRRMVLFHGTSDKFLESIFGNGLNPNPKNKVWSDDPVAAKDRPSRASVGGTYLTGNLLTAMSSARNAIDKFDGRRLIVCVLFEPRSGLPDEDSIISTLEREVTYATGSKGGQNDRSDQLTLGDLILGNKESFEEFKEGIKENFFKIEDDIYSKQKIDLRALNEKTLYDFFLASLIRRVAHYFEDSEKGMGSLTSYKFKGFQYWLDNEDSPEAKKIEAYLKTFPSVQQAESDYRKAMDAMSRMLKKTAYTATDDFAYTVRTTEPLKMSGRNKIIAILRLVPQKDHLDSVEILYGEPPEEFLKQYKSRISDNIDLVDRRKRP